MSSSGARQPGAHILDGATRPASVAEAGSDSPPEGAEKGKGAPKPGPRGRWSGWLRLLSLAATLFSLLITVAAALPPLAALACAGWALYLACSALWGLGPLIVSGQALTSAQTPVYLHTLDFGGRVGFVAVGYLALIFSLMTLMAGLFGRRWGRLFVAPGALFVATSLTLLGIALFNAAPLIGGLALPATWWVALGLYTALDSVLVGGALVDARLTRSPTATGQFRAAPKPARTRKGARLAEPVDARPAW